MGTRRADDPPLYFETHVFVCCNRRPDGHPRGSCAAKGSEKIRDYFKARAKELGLEGVRINTSLCLDRCELGPCAVFYPEGIWYRLARFEDVERVIEEHMKRGGRVRELMLDAPQADTAALEGAGESGGGG